MGDRQKPMRFPFASGWACMIAGRCASYAKRTDEPLAIAHGHGRLATHDQQPLARHDPAPQPMGDQQDLMRCPFVYGWAREIDEQCASYAKRNDGSLALAHGYGLPATSDLQLPARRIVTTYGR